MFAQTGLPQRLRVDNGAPWGKRSDLPTAFGLWLIGLGVELLWNPPRRPEKNGVVERSQGTIWRWVVPGTCRDAQQLQQRLDRGVAFQREVYPAIDGKSRSEAYPQLAAGGRPYDPTREAQQWQLERVCGWLEQGTWRRLVDKAGKISLDNRGYQAGERRAGQWVSVRFDGSTKAWVLLEPGGQEIKRYAAEEITAERIVALDVAHQKSSRRIAKEAQRAAATARVQPGAG